MQTDGNLVEYDHFGQSLWQSGTAGKSVTAAVMQGDGNFVLYGTSGAALWSSRTYGHPGAYLAMQDDSNLVIYAAGGRPALWSTGIFTQKKYVHLTWCATLGCGTWEQDIDGYYFYDGKSAWAYFNQSGQVQQPHCWSPGHGIPVLNMTITRCGTTNNRAHGGPLEFESDWNVVVPSVDYFFPWVNTFHYVGHTNIYPDGTSTQSLITN